MFRKYEKTYRAVGKSGKLALSHAERIRLFNGKLVIEEKMDGANVGIIRHKKGFHLQKRGSLVGSSEHPQFQRFHAWANNEKYDSIMKIPLHCTVYGEWLYATHNIPYRNLPDYFLMFDVWNNIKKRYLDRFEREDFIILNNLDFYQVPILFDGYIDYEDAIKMIPRASEYGEYAEGIVVKRYTKGRQYYKGKIVDPRFHKELEESDHWRDKPFKVNELK